MGLKAGITPPCWDVLQVGVLALRLRGGTKKEEEMKDKFLHM